MISDPVQAELSDNTSRPPGVAPRLTVLMPIYNEASTLLKLLARIRAVPLDKEIVLIDDGSSDDTPQILTELSTRGDPNIVILKHDTNQGKGAALRTGIPHARGRFVIVQDGDMEYDPADYIPIVEALEATGAAAVYGSRFLASRPRMRPANLLVNYLLAWMVRVFYGSRITDEATCYKAFRRDVIQAAPLTCRRFEFCPEVTSWLLRSGEKIHEVPICYSARGHAEGKKIRWTDGVQAIWTLVRMRFSALPAPFRRRD